MSTAHRPSPNPTLRLTGPMTAHRCRSGRACCANPAHLPPTIWVFTPKIWCKSPPPGKYWAACAMTKCAVPLTTLARPAPSATSRPLMIGAHALACCSSLTICTLTTSRGARRSTLRRIRIRTAHSVPTPPPSKAATSKSVPSWTRPTSVSPPVWRSSNRPSTTSAIPILIRPLPRFCCRANATPPALKLT